VIRRTLVAAALTLAALAGCGTAPRGATPSSAPGATQLTATLASADSVRLTWRGGEPDAAGRVVEFATGAGGQYTILQFVPPRQTTFTHPDLMPATAFHYRIRPYFGPVSNAVEVQLPPGPVDDNAEPSDQPWAAPRKLPRGPVTARSIRGTGAAAAAPTDLVATLMPAGAGGVRFTWVDHASDEEGYLLELRTPGSADYTVTEVLDPDVTSVGLLTLADQRSATVRVRAFYYGRPSNIATQHT